MLERFVRNIIEKEGKKTVVDVPVDSISVNPYQPRRHFDEKKLQELAQSIREQGVIQPIIVRRLGGAYELVAGERRLRAAKMVDLKTVPAIIRQLDDQDMVEIAFIENLQREQLNEVEEAEAYGRLMTERGATGPEEVAQRVGKDVDAIKTRLWMLSLPQVVKKAVVSRLISLEHARTISQVAGEKNQMDLLEKIYREKLTSDASRIYVEKMPGMLRAGAPLSRPAAPAPVYSLQSLQRIDLCVGMLRDLILAFRRTGVRVGVTESIDAEALHIRLTFPVEHRPN